MAPALVLLTLASLDGGALSVRDVEPGDFVEYEARRGAEAPVTLRLQACERTASGLIVAVSTSMDGGAGTLTRGVQVELPFAPLSPAPDLSPPSRWQEVTVDGRELGRCAVWESDPNPKTTHPGSRSVTRCSRRELVLGSGLVAKQVHPPGLIGVGANSTEDRLVRLGRSRVACAPMPRAPLAGPWSRSRERFVATAGSTWVRVERVTPARAVLLERPLVELLLELVWVDEAPRPGRPLVAPLVGEE